MTRVIWHGYTEIPESIIWNGRGRTIVVWTFAPSASVFQCLSQPFLTGKNIKYICHEIFCQRTKLPAKQLSSSRVTYFHIIRFSSFSRSTCKTTWFPRWRATLSLRRQTWRESISPRINCPNFLSTHSLYQAIRQVDRRSQPGNAGEMVS